MTEAVAAEAVTPEGGDGGSSVHLASGDLAARWRAVLDEQPLAVGDNYARDNSLQEAGCKSQYSIFSRIPEAERRGLIHRILDECPRDPIAKAVGAMVGMAAADATGHWFEFMAACDEPGARGVRFEVDKLTAVPGLFVLGARDTARMLGPRDDGAMERPPCFTGPERPLNKFQLQLGQWTDDCSMGLCIGDSLLLRGRYDGSDLRVRFWNWWHRGYCNAFGRDQCYGPRPSVGLGGSFSRELPGIAVSTWIFPAIPTPCFDLYIERQPHRWQYLEVDLHYET